MTQHEAGTVSTDVLSRLGRLPWARWHWLVLVGLGTVRILDGRKKLSMLSLAAGCCWSAPRRCSARACWAPGR